MTRSESSPSPLSQGSDDRASTSGVSEGTRLSPEDGSQSSTAGPEDESEQLTDEQIAEIESRLRYLGYID